MHQKSATAHYRTPPSQVYFSLMGDLQRRTYHDRMLVLWAGFESSRSTRCSISYSLRCLPRRFNAVIIPPSPCRLASPRSHAPSPTAVCDPDCHHSSDTALLLRRHTGDPTRPGEPDRHTYPDNFANRPPADADLDDHGDGGVDDHSFSDELCNSFRPGHAHTDANRHANLDPVYDTDHLNDTDPHSNRHSCTQSDAGPAHEHPDFTYGDDHSCSTANASVVGSYSAWGDIRRQGGTT